ncbi:hypothetical protein ACIQUS_02680 [Pseudomonas sp. NPDC090755]|uniref:hypothetical protein n=1 Tax=Pseudomonas sp. NPDC090755 TaxID=3364481 RepID=UPI00383BAA3B
MDDEVIVEQDLSATVAAETQLPEEHLPEAESAGINSGCPGGRLSGGICMPFNNAERKTWMYSYRGNRSISSLPIGGAILPGSHNSGFDKEAGYTPSSQTCQDVSIYKQLMAGIRVLDLRVHFYSNSSGSRRFSIFHSTTNGRTVEVDVLDALLRYRRDAGASREIVILNFHEFRDFNPAAHRELAALINRKLGRSLIPRSCMEVAVSQFWELGRNTIISYNTGTSEPYWPGVNQRWIGSNTPSKNKMEEFIRKVGNESKPFGMLRSVQAAYYSLPFFVPKDLSGDVMKWFAAGNDSHPIQKHYIINTDWSLRQRLIDNIIYGNGVRAEQRGAHVNVSSPNRSGSVVPTRSYGIYAMANGNWSATLSFAVNSSTSTSIQVIRSDATFDSQLRMSNGSTLKISKGDRLVFRVPPGQGAQLIERFTA